MDTELEYKTFFKDKSDQSKRDSQTKDIDSTIEQKDEKDLKEDKKNNEIKETKQPKESIVEYPKLELLCVNNRNEQDRNKVIITPNSINGEVRSNSKFVIGKNDKNDFTFKEGMGNKQFEIHYDRPANKYNIIDTKMGTGLFVKIQTKLQIKQDTIVSFCQTHMIIQTDSTSNLY
jgi:hypothetical protein